MSGSDFALYLAAVTVLTVYLLWRTRPIGRSMQRISRAYIGQRLTRLKRTSKGNYKPSQWIVTAVMGRYARVEPIAGLGGSEWIRADKIR